MNGPDHYREAQTLAARTTEILDNPDCTPTDSIAVGIAAIAHGLLALTAATAATQTLTGRAIWQETTR